MTHGSLSEDPPLWIMYLVKINHLLLAINSAINILIYSFKVRHFILLFFLLYLAGEGPRNVVFIYVDYTTVKYISLKKGESSSELDETLREIISLPIFVILIPINLESLLTSDISNLHDKSIFSFILLLILWPHTSFQSFKCHGVLG